MNLEKYSGKLPLVQISLEDFTYTNTFPQFQIQNGRLTPVSLNFLKRIINADADLGEDVVARKLKIELCRCASKHKFVVIKQDKVIFDGHSLEKNFEPQEAGVASVPSETLEEDDCYEFLVTEFRSMHRNLDSQLEEFNGSLVELLDIRMKIIMSFKSNIWKLLEKIKERTPTVANAEKAAVVKQIQELEQIKNAVLTDLDESTDRFSVCTVDQLQSLSKKLSIPV
jgi:hypothetical protein